jgi:Pvc16 N-terminal domain
MALGQLGVLDLSIITDTLKDLLDSCITNTLLWQTENITPPPTIIVTGAQPEAVVNDGNCQLSLYLLHVCQDKFQRNTPVLGNRTSVVPLQPLALDLYYLLTAYAGKNYILEQQAMSIAMRCFYNNPIIKTVVQGDAHQEFTLSMEVDSADERSRLWQALATPLRLSVVYRVSVVFITPDVPATLPALPVTKIDLSVIPASLPSVSGTVRTVTFAAPDNTAAHPDIRTLNQVPATVAAGQSFLLQGNGLNQDTSHRVYLLTLDGTEYDVTSAWLVSGSPLAPQSATQMVLQLPAAVGSPPANTPPAGVYQLRVGSDQASGDATTIRSNATPFRVAALVDAPSLTATPLLTPDAGGVFTLSGAGFIAGNTEVILSTIPLTATSSSPNAGEFNVNASGTVITFKLPASIVSGQYTVRIQVNQVESAPAWWINIP